MDYNIRKGNTKFEVILDTYYCELQKPNTLDEDGCNHQCTRCKNGQLNLKSFMQWVKNIFIKT